MDYFHGIAINAKKEVLTDMSSITNTIMSTTVNTVNSGNISGGSVSIPYFSYQSVQGKFNSKTTANTTADTTIQTSTTHTHIWTFQLKGQGKDLFRVILDDNFLILDGDDIAGYATRNGGYMDCSVTKNITRNISNENQILTDTENYKPIFNDDLITKGAGVGGILGLIFNKFYFQWSYIALFIIGAIGSGILTAIGYNLLVYNKKLREYERVLADTKSFLDDFENRVAGEKVNEETGLIINASPQEQIEVTSEAEQIETK